MPIHYSRNKADVFRPNVKQFENEDNCVIVRLK